jgi:hypothetical protein
MEQQADILDVTPDAATDGPPPADVAGTPEGGASSSGDILDTTVKDVVSEEATKDVLSDDDASGDEGVPDRYEFDLTDELKEKGFELDEGKFEAFSEAAKEMGFTQSQFQSIIEYQFEQQQAATEEAVGHWQERVEGWKTAARTDKEFGGENFDANVKAAMKVATKFGDADLTALVKSPSAENPDGLALGNHPAFLRFVNRISKVLSDTDLVLGEDVQKSDATEARLRRIYPTMYKD